MKLLVIKDMKSGLFLRPSFSPSIADAMRNFEVLSNEGDSMVSRFPADFRLFHLADFDAETGILSSLDSPSDLGSALDVKHPAPQGDLPFTKQ